MNNIYFGGSALNKIRATVSPIYKYSSTIAFYILNHFSEKEFNLEALISANCDETATNAILASYFRAVEIQ